MALKTAVNHIGKPIEFKLRNPSGFAIEKEFHGPREINGRN